MSTRTKGTSGPRNHRRAMPLVLLTLLAGTSAIQAQSGNYLLLVADTATVTGALRTSLLNTGLLGNVDIHPHATTLPTPTLAQLMQYDAVLTYTNQSYADGAAMGDVLADYVDSGGGVVVAVYAVSTTTANRSLRGRWETGGYDIIPARSGNTTTATSLGTVHLPSHALWNGMTGFSGSTNYARSTTVDAAPHAVRVADWATGGVLAATSTVWPNRVDLNFYPSPWHTTTDGARLLANALIVAGTPQTGACCLGGGQCQLLLPSACEAQNGVYQGAGSTCGSVNCPQFLTTLFAGANGGLAGGVIYFDLNVTSPISIQAIATNTTTLGPIGATIYSAPTSYIGNEENPGAWTQVSTASGAGIGINQPSLLTLDTPTIFNPGTYGIAIVGAAPGFPSFAHRYTNGTGSNQFYSVPEFSLAAGAAQNGPFTTAPLSPRVWNGTIYYGGAVACCFLSSCAILTPAACTAQGGTPVATAINCAAANCATYQIVEHLPGVFTDIGTTGSFIVSGDDASSPFFSSVVNELMPDPNMFASTNGVISSASFTAFSNVALPAAAAGRAFFPFWDDLFADATQNGAVLHEARTENGINVHIVQWNNVRTFAGGSTAPTSTFQVKIFESGPVLAQYIFDTMNYVGANANGGSATIGYQASGQAGNNIQYSLNQPVIFGGTVLSIISSGGGGACYANCDGSTVAPVLNVDDFTCFINEYAQAQTLPHEQQVTHYANCDGSTIAPALNVDDFTCFINRYAQGCP
jgi:hypothetical protein